MSVRYTFQIILKMLMKVIISKIFYPFSVYNFDDILCFYCFVHLHVMVVAALAYKITCAAAVVHIFASLLYILSIQFWYLISVVM